MGQFAEQQSMTNTIKCEFSTALRTYRVSDQHQISSTLNRLTAEPESKIRQNGGGKRSMRLSLTSQLSTAWVTDEQQNGSLAGEWADKTSFSLLSLSVSDSPCLVSLSHHYLWNSPHPATSPLNPSLKEGVCSKWLKQAATSQGFPLCVVFVGWDH